MFSGDGDGEQLCLSDTNTPALIIQRLPSLPGFRQNWIHSPEELGEREAVGRWSSGPWRSSREQRKCLLALAPSLAEVQLLSDIIGGWGSSALGAAEGQNRGPPWLEP